MNGAFVAVFGTNSEMSFDGSNQVPTDSTKINRPGHNIRMY